MLPIFEWVVDHLGALTISAVFLVVLIIVVRRLVSWQDTTEQSGEVVLKNAYQEQVYEGRYYRQQQKYSICFLINGRRKTLECGPGFFESVNRGDKVVVVHNGSHVIDLKETSEV